MPKTEISPEQMRNMESPLDDDINAMVAETFDEQARSAFNHDPDLDGEIEPDNNNDRELEQPEDIEGLPQDDVTADPGDEDVEANEDEPEADDEEGHELDDGPPMPPPSPEQRIPLTRLQEETTRRREVETRQREQEAELNRLRGEMEALRRMQPQQPPQPAQPRPDPILDPDGARLFDQNDRIVRMLNHAERDPDEGWKVQAAGNWAMQSLNLHDPRNRQQLFEYLRDSPDPAGSLVKMWERQGGGRERIEQMQQEREQREYEAFVQQADRFGYQVPDARPDARRQSQSNGIPPRPAQPRQPTQLPKSLNTAGGRRVVPDDPGMYDSKPQSYNDFAFSDRRS
jgi:hypothetical protein